MPVELTYTLDRAENGTLVARCELPNGETWNHYVGGRPQNPDRPEDVAHVADLLKRDANRRTDAPVDVPTPDEADRKGMARAFESMVPMYQEMRGNSADAVPE